MPAELVVIPPTGPRGTSGRKVVQDVVDGGDTAGDDRRGVGGSAGLWPRNITGMSA